MAQFTPVTDADLARSRSDPAFRQKLLEQSLEVLLAGLQTMRNAAASRKGSNPVLMREAVEAAVKLAELIQTPGKSHRAGR